jgi:hypothetical protein
MSGKAIKGGKWKWLGIRMRRKRRKRRGGAPRRKQKQRKTVRNKTKGNSRIGRKEGTNKVGKE